MELKDRVALITGADSGLGYAVARRLARAGAAIVAVARNREALDETVREIEADGGRALAVVADVAQPDQVERAVSETVREFGGLHLVFANAGVNGVWAPLEDLKPEDWISTLSINLTGTFLTIKYAAPHLKKQGGAVVVCSSVNGTRTFSNTGATAYASSKAGQVALTKMVALELAKHRVRVNVICPGAIDTPIHEKTKHRNDEKEKEPVEFPEGKIPLTDGEPGSPEQVAELVLFLCSDASSHITGSEIWIDGGESLLKG